MAIDPTVLGVACQPEAAGFRLCTLHELKETYETARLAAIEADRRAAQERRSGRGMAI